MHMRVTLNRLVGMGDWDQCDFLEIWQSLGTRRPAMVSAAAPQKGERRRGKGCWSCSSARRPAWRERCLECVFGPRKSYACAARASARPENVRTPQSYEGVGNSLKFEALPSNPALFRARGKSLNFHNIRLFLNLSSPSSA